MGNRRWYVLALGVMLSVSLWAQQDSLSSCRVMYFDEGRGTQWLDSMIVLSASVEVVDRVGGVQVASDMYELDQHSIEWKKPYPHPIEVHFRVLPSFFTKKYTNLDTSLLQKDIYDGLIGYNPYDKRDEGGLIDERGLNYRGNFTRGVSVGNNQDLVLNSRFNLQMSGLLKDDIRVEAAITDENLPLQAEGNTRQLKEFDRLFIKLSKNNKFLTAGDYSLVMPRNTNAIQKSDYSSYFMNYNKKLQGASFEGVFNEDGKYRIKGRTAFAVARGQFVSTSIAVTEGNQGPYKLLGKNGETFIIVLSGTEKVWLDGEPLARGIEDDYVIDYNLGELTFTSKILITRDTRITIEYEYTTQQYLKSLYGGNVHISHEAGKSDFYINVLSTQDSKQNQGDFQLSDADRQALQTAGDDPDKSIRSTIDSLEAYSAERVSYYLKDSTIACGAGMVAVQFLKFATEADDDQQLYTATFSNVGGGNGNYIQSSSVLANQQVYEYIAPDPITCEPQGSYEPVGAVKTPEKQQMFTVGTKQVFGKNTVVRLEGAFSNVDKNRFSVLDSGDNWGWGTMINVENQSKVGKKDWKLTSQASGEYKNVNFQALNPYRSAEFARDWNYNTASASDEYLLNAGLSLEKKGKALLEYQMKRFNSKDVYDGFRQNAHFQYRSDSWLIQGKGSYLNSESNEEKSTFFRPHISMEKDLGKAQNWKILFDYEQENNRRSGIISDTLTSLSRKYDQFKGEILHSKEKGKLRLALIQRTDFTPSFNEFVLASEAWQWSLEGDRKWKKGLVLGGRLNYRQLIVTKALSKNDRSANTLLGRVNMQWNPKSLKGALRFNTNYELGSGQEPLITVSYTKVPVGSGTHIWLDSLYNNDGVIQYYEMTIAPFPDQADYIPVRNISNEFIQTQNSAIQQNFELNPRLIWQDKKGWKKAASRFSWRSLARINRKTQKGDELDAWNVYKINLVDTSLVALNANFQHTLFFNKGHSSFDARLGTKDLRTRFFQSNGFEYKGQNSWFVGFRWNITKALSFESEATIGDKESASEFSNEKNYTYTDWEVTPELSYLPTQKFRIKAGGNWQEYDAESVAANLKEGWAEVSWRKAAQTSLDFRFSYIKATFDGDSNTPIGFDILNGLQKGNNLIWNVTWNRPLSKVLQLGLRYEGRKTGEAKVVHTGNVQVSARF